MFRQIETLAECLRRASKARHHEHMTDLMALSRLLSQGLTNAEIEQAKIKAED